jgi:hypothetical protein
MAAPTRKNGRSASRLSEAGNCRGGPNWSVPKIDVNWEGIGTQLDEVQIAIAVDIEEVVVCGRNNN